MFENDIDAAVERWEAEQQAQRAERRTRSLTALILLLAGAVALLVAVTALLSWPWSLLVFGMMCIIVSFMIGMDGSPDSDKRGQRS